MLDNEEKLIKKAIRRDGDSFSALYDHYQPQIYRFVLIKVGKKEDAEDLTHQVFLNAWQNVGGYRLKGFPFSSWLYSIARNQIIDFYRSRKPVQSLEKIDPESLSEESREAENLSEKMKLEKVMSAVRHLKFDYQDVLIMRFVEDLSLKETAAAIKKSEGSVKLIQHRAIEQLKSLLNQNG
ncbi:MAG: sigma-70 family RNA polymerase sigma factor [Patescibacteria group bacterium]|nr:sigma-70 family RNA polymerase sigma factor [Patescibacteria group bacterium]